MSVREQAFSTAPSLMSPVCLLRVCPQHYAWIPRSTRYCVRKRRMACKGLEKSRMLASSELNARDVQLGPDVLRFLLDIDQMLWCAAFLFLVEAFSALVL